VEPVFKMKEKKLKNFKTKFIKTNRIFKSLNFRIIKIKTKEMILKEEEILKGIS
jgi:hypothetical protein